LGLARIARLASIKNESRFLYSDAARRGLLRQDLAAFFLGSIEAVRDLQKRKRLRDTLPSAA
jgi:hypothetical protein